MSEPQRLPRKYLSQLLQAQEELRLLGHKARRAYERLSSSSRDLSSIEATLRDIESGAYRIALELAELKVVDDCSGCPAAPPTLPARAHLLVLADELERQALLARRHAQSVFSIEEELESQLQWKATLFYRNEHCPEAKK